MLLDAPTILVKILVNIYGTILLDDVSWVVLVSLNHITTIRQLLKNRKKKIQLNEDSCNSLSVNTLWRPGAVTP
jgi:hypothetical protein